ncbi:hypothetical protein Mapa_004041 [Marchantia paleacea]|nr:hypothetical protein Mapa_004041 [Marchantia paleacea]
MESFTATVRKVSWKGRTFTRRCRRRLDFQMEKICESRWAREYLTFYRLHMSYFLSLAILGAFILWLSHRSRQRQMSIVDAIFNSTSILTVTGLTTLRMAEFSLGDKLFLLVLMTLGSHAFTSLLPLCVRRYHFHRHHKWLVRESMKDWHGHSHEGDSVVVQTTPPGKQVSSLNESPAHFLDVEDASDRGRLHHTLDSKANGVVSDHENHMAVLSEVDQNHPYVYPLQVPGDLDSASDGGRLQQTVASKGNGDLNDHKRCYGVVVLSQGDQHVPTSAVVFSRTDEHQSLVTLSTLVPCYIIVVQLLVFVLNLLYVALRPKAERILRVRDVNSVFFSFFTAVAAFTNSGAPVHDDNLVPFQNEHFLLLLYTTCSLSGNLLYPLFLRLLIQFFHRISSGVRKQALNYLLEHPRKCYTHLFPARQTWWLALTLLGFTAVQLIFFCALDWDSNALKGLSTFSKIIAGIYQSVSVRNSGGAVVAISELSPTMLVLYVFMMYIAAYPIFLLRQNSSEYEKADIAVFHETKLKPDTTDNSLLFQTRKLLAKDSAYLCVIIFTICVIEGNRVVEDPLNFSIFNIVFEVVSAYGGVGMSVGYSCALRLSQSSACEDVPYSFSGQWSPGGKLILSVVMLMGRHRGLPDEIDSAIKIPSFNPPQPPATSARNSVNIPPDETHPL